MADGENKKGHYGDFIEELVENTALGFGGGVMTQTLFNIASGATVSSVHDVLSGSFVIILTAIGFGLGFARGHKKMIQ